MNAQKNEATLKIHAGGTGMVLFLSITIFFWLGLLWSFKDKIQALGADITYYSFVKDLIAGLALCVFFSVYSFIYWKFNFIELTSDRLIASVSDRSKRSIWPKFVKTNIAFSDIKAVSLNKIGVLLPTVFKIIDKNNKTHHIDTKPFSKVSCWRLIKELERRVIPVEIEKGAI